jgi:hypothetical protein
MPFTRLRQSLIQPNGSITGSLLGTASYAVTSSYAMNGGSGGGSTPVVSVASLNNQTILYNFSSSQEATITGLTLTNNNWGINVVEEWNSGSGDIYYPSSSILLHFSGSNNSTTFIDSSRNNFVITASGNVKITSSISKFESRSGFFDGTGDNLLINYNTAFNLSGDFTIEVWFYPVSLNDSYILNFAGGLNIAWASYALFVNANGVHFVGSSTNSGYDIGSEGLGAGTIGALTLNTWSHIAVTRQGNVYRGFINGVQGYTQTLALTPYNPNARGLSIGGNYANTWGGTPVSSINGYLDELRITKGVARYTASFVTQSVQFPDTLPQYETKYVGLIGGLNDTGSDYGIQKLDDTSLKIRKMSVSGTPVSGSPVLSSSVDRVYVNVLNYSNVSVGSTLLGQTFTAVGSTSSYALSRSVVNPYEIVVAVDGAVQSFNDAYSVTSSTINFTENIPSGSLVDIRYLTTPNVNSASYAATSSLSTNSLTASSLVTTNNYTVSTLNINSSGSTSASTNGSLTISGQNTKGGANYHDFLYITNTVAGAVNPNKYFRQDNTGNLEIINSNYGTNIFALTDSGSLQLPTAQSANVTQLRNTGAGLKVGNYGLLFDDGNVHLHSTSPGTNLWLNCSGSGMFVVNGQSGSTGGMCIGTSIQKGFVTIVGSVSAAITQPYGYLISSGAGTTTGTSPNPYSLTCDSRIMAQEFDAPSDERLKNIDGEIPLNEAVDFVNKVISIKYKWKDGVDTGTKTGYSAQQVYKSGFDHLVGIVKKEGMEEIIESDGFINPKDAQFVMNYEQVTPYHSKVIKHLLEKIEQLENRISQLENK